MTGGTAVSGAVNVLTTATNTFTYTAGTSLLTSGTMDVTKPSTTVTVTSTAHGLSVGTTSIYVPTISPGVLGAYTATYIDANTFTYTAGTSLLTAYNTPGTLSFATAGTTVTVTSTAHGLIVGESVYMSITSGASVSGNYVITAVPDANTFTYTEGTSRLVYTTPGSISFVNNGFSVGQYVYIDFAATLTDGFFTITAVTAFNIFTFTYVSSGTNSGSGFIKRLIIRAKGNVAFVSDGGTGFPVVNFRSPMFSADYCVTATSSTAQIYVNEATTPTTYYVALRTTTSAGVATNSTYTYISITQ